MNHPNFLSFKTSNVLTENSFRLEKRSLHFPSAASAHKVLLMGDPKGNFKHS
jgi:hypothetical protein